MTVDVHAHFWPNGLLKAAHSGDSWFGWEPVRLGSGQLAIALGDRLIRFPIPESDLQDPQTRASRRSARGIEAEVIMHIGFLWNQHLEGEEASRHGREINEELATAQYEAPESYRGLGVLPFHAPELFERELATLVETGLTAVALPASVRGENLDGHRILPLIEMIIDADLAMVLHPTYLAPPGAARMPRYYFVNSIGASLECTVGLMSLIQSGVFDRHEHVRMVVVQGGGSVPYEIGRFSLRYHERKDLRTMAQPPDAYLRRVHYDCMVADSDSLAFLAARVGTDRIVIGTDHPFRSDVSGGAVAWVSGHPTLSAADKTSILTTNAHRLFGF